MSSAFEQGVKAAVHDLVDLETRRFLPMLAAVIPGAVGELARQILLSPEVQAKIIEAEDKAADWLIDEAAKAAGWLASLVQAHVGKKLGDAIYSVEHTAPPLLHLNAEQVRKLLVLVASGKFDAFVDEFLTDLHPTLAPGAGK